MNIFAKGQGAFIKVVSLAIGLTVGLVLIAKVQLEMNYDRCIVDKQHVYAVGESFTKEGDDPAEHENTPGGAIPALCHYIPEIVVGTRYTYLFNDEKLTMEDGSRYAFEQTAFADSCFFDIFGTRILQGDVKRILSTSGQCLVSRRLSEKMGGDVVGQVCDRLYPDAELVVKSYSNELADSYRETKHTRDLIIIGCLASLLITLIGLIGYVRDEVQRRSRELAIRKVMGAGVGELQALFLRSIALIAIPSIIVGIALGWYFSNLLMEQLADKIPLVWYVFAACALFVLLIIASIVLLQTHRVTTSNPVNYLKTE